MKQKHPTHDLNPTSMLSCYLQMRREYAHACGGYLGISEADDTYNDLDRKVIDAYWERHTAIGKKRVF